MAMSVMDLLIEFQSNSALVGRTGFSNLVCTLLAGLLFFPTQESCLHMNKLQDLFSEVKLLWEK
jgi:hypothetical protein